MACVYSVINNAGERVSFNTSEEALKYARENNLIDRLVKGDPSNTTATLANVLRQMAFGEINYNPQQLRVFQDEVLDEFIRLEEQSQFFYKMGSPIALTKGLGKNFDQMNGIRKNLADLGIGMSQLEFDDANIPFDVRYLLTGDSQYKPENADPYYHKITAGNVKKMNEIVSLSKTIFLEQAPLFINTSAKVIANLKDSVANSVDKVREITDELSAFYQIAAYKKWIEMHDKKTDTLRNSLIYDSEVSTKANETIVDIVKEATRLAPENTFLQFILPVSTTVKIGKKKVRNINNKDIINTVEGKTRGKIEPDLIATMMDSFTELYQNPATRRHAQALFDYLIVKDGLMFKNKSFIKMLPTMMFDNISNAVDIGTELMSLSAMEQYTRFLRKLEAMPVVDKEGNAKEYFTAAEKAEYNTLVRNRDLTGVRDKLFNKVFGMGYDQLYNRFEGIYATDQKYQYNLDLIKPKVKTKTGSRQADGLAFAEENGKQYLHVNMFPQKFKDTAPGSDARKAVFSDLMDQFAQAGFGAKEVSEDKKELIFKKFVRLKKNTGGNSSFIMGMEETTPKGGEYITYQLIQVQRKVGDSLTTFTGPEMTPEGELTPRGVYAVYTPIDVVGTSNSTGVANLGPRPTKAQVLATLENKLKNDNDNNQTPPAVGPVNPVGPTPISPTSGGISFSEDSSTGYKERTIKNASADATIAIAVDFNSAGEKLTKTTVIQQGKKYIPIDGNNFQITPERVKIIVDSLNSVNAKSLNIAGNGIYTMKGKYTQQQVDDFTYQFLKAVVESPDLKNKITSIRTGGQTGFDEAGAKAGAALGIPTSILAPKGWKFRDIDGNDISDEQQFKARFGTPPAPIQGSLFGNPTPTPVAPISGGTPPQEGTNTGSKYPIEKGTVLKVNTSTSSHSIIVDNYKEKGDRISVTFTNSSNVQITYTGKIGADGKFYPSQISDLKGTRNLSTATYISMDFPSINTLQTPAPTPITGGVFGGLTQLPYDPNDMNPSDFFMSDKDITDSLNKKDKC